MAEVLLFHHAQGLTPGLRALAGELRAAGHTVHTPDLVGVGLGPTRGRVGVGCSVFSPLLAGHRTSDPRSALTVVAP